VRLLETEEGDKVIALAKVVEREDEKEGVEKGAADGNGQAGGNA
jgi:hypothetical protein